MTDEELDSINKLRVKIKHYEDAYDVTLVFNISDKHLFMNFLTEFIDINDYRKKLQARINELKKQFNETVIIPPTSY